MFLGHFSSAETQAEHTGIAASLRITAKAARKAFILCYIDFFFVKFFCHFMKFF